MREGCSGVEPLLSAWVDGALASSDRVHVLAHLRACEECRTDVERLEHTKALLRNVPVRRLPEPVRAVVTQPVRSLPPPRHLVSRLAAAVVTALLVGMGTGALLTEPRERAVAVPVDMFVADHLAQTLGAPVTMPVLVEGP